jgi:hypothetical protein
MQEGEGLSFQMEIVEDGIAKAAALANGKKAVIPSVAYAPVSI